MKSSYSLCMSFIIAALIALAACSSPVAATIPSVVIVAPPQGSTYSVGETVAVQSAAADPSGISRVELMVDGALVKQDSPPTLPAPSQFSVIQDWTAAGAGQHTLTVRASNPSGGIGETGIVVNIIAAPSTNVSANTPVVPTASIPTRAPQQPNPTAVTNTSSPAATNPPLPANTTAPAATVCTYDSQFVADVTIPDRTPVTPGQAFTKTWRVRNSGNCAWDANSALVFIGGAQLGATSPLPLPNVAPGATDDLALPMQAPAQPGDYLSTWRMRAPNGNLFGTNLTVVVTVPGAPTKAPTQIAAQCAGTPNDFSFSVSSTTIKKGETVTLSWGSVTNATGAFLSGGEFANTGVETPGSRNSRPPTTTTYTLNAVCNVSGQNRAKSVTVTVTDNTNLGPLNGNFSLHPEFSPRDFSFFAIAGDIDAPCEGADGCNIDHVDLYLYDPNGKLVHKRTERNPSYCAFGGGDNGAPCNFYVYGEHGNRWPDGTRIISGTYRMYAEAFSKDGRKKTIEDFVELTPD